MGANMQDCHFRRALVPNGDLLRLIVDRPVSTQNDLAQIQHASLTLVFGRLRRRFRQLLHRNPRAGKYTLLLPDGHLLVLCCATLSQLVCGCASAAQNREVGCTL